MGRIRGHRFWHLTFLSICAISLALVVNQIFHLKLLGVSLLENSYMYCILAFFLSPAFLIFPASSSSPKDRIPPYDILLFLITFFASMYMAFHGTDIISKGWEYSSPSVMTLLSICLWLLVLEAVRRVSDICLAGVCLFFSIYPVFTGYFPWVFKGFPLDFLTTARQHVMSTNSILGIPLNVCSTLLIGFILFGVILQHTGGGVFFFKLAQSLLGHTRGGAAKMAVLGSAFFGMMSGSTVSNVLTIGAMTIPAMKRTGYPSHYAAAIESCSSTGGPIMPPVMGAGGFIMASFLNWPYYQIAIGAFIPACLYFLGLFVQVHGYAVKKDLKGLPREELPGFWTTMKSGWFYILIILVLCYLLLALRIETRAPFFASLGVLILAMFKKETRLSWKQFIDMILAAGVVMIQMTSILAAAGLIIGGLAVTGVALAFSRELVAAAGNNAFLILLIGAAASFILGLGMSITACYIFLAIVMVPGLVQLGIDPLAAHLFVFYWGALSEITPPVALCVAAACGIAGSDFMKTGWTAMRLGAVKYLVPFFFAYSPALLTHAEWWNVVLSTFFAAVGVSVLACGLEGYMVWIGNLRHMWSRIFFIVGGVLMAFPEIYTTLAGLIICVSAFAASYIRRERFAPI